MDASVIALAVTAAVVGGGAGYMVRRQLGSKNAASVEEKIEDKIRSAKEKVVFLHLPRRMRNPPGRRG